MSTTLHTVFNIFFGSVYFVTVVQNSHGRKNRLSEGSQNSLSEKSIFGDFEVAFLNI